MRESNKGSERWKRARGQGREGGEYMVIKWKSQPTMYCWGNEAIIFFSLKSEIQSKELGLEILLA